MPWLPALLKARKEAEKAKKKIKMRQEEEEKKRKKVEHKSSQITSYFLAGCAPSSVPRPL